MKKFTAVFLLIFFINCTHTKQNKRTAALQPYEYAVQKSTTSKNGVVVSAHTLASRVGVAVMKQGGNAIDAAIATQLALAVVYPNAGNIGGGGFMVARLSNGKTVALDYREMAPGASHRDMYLDKDGNVIEGKSVNGHLSSGIPGTIAGLFASATYARLPFKQLIQPAIDLAAKGFVITQHEAQSFNNLFDELNQYNTVPSVFQKRKWKAGDTLVQTELAQTLERIRDRGAKGFYEGKTASLLVEEMKRGGGIMTLEDLKNYKALWRTPHTFPYKGYAVVSMPLPSSGGLLLHQMMKMIEDKPLASYGFNSPQGVQLMTEVERRAYADRAFYMGDADFFQVPQEKLTSDAYLKERMKDYQPGKAGNSKLVKPGVTAFKESEQTTHLSVIDAEGNAVSVTTTLNNSYGSKTVVGGAGFFLNDEMDDFSAKPGVPNLYGAVGGEANAILPGKRMLSSMTPTIVLKDEKPFLVVGTPGGTTIPTSVFQTIINVIEFNMSTKDAVNQPKFHHQWLPDEVYIETNFSATTKAALEKMGYHLIERNGIGRTDVIRVLADGRFEGVADSRGDDSAEGY